MQKTRTLYYEDNKLFDFTATVLACDKEENGYSVVLDKTAFFPEAGGQSGDVGYINGVKVFDTQIKDGVIYHYAEEAFQEGQTVSCRVDEYLRMKKMASHSGEHILSSVVCRRFGYDNVGFHLGEKGMDVDFNGDFTKEQLKEIELEVNDIIRKNVPIKCYYPTKEELANIKYRSKLELDEPRIVEIVGYDYCACCAPHVSFTGEVGYLIITDSCRNRNNTRLTVLAGEDACRYVAEMYLSAYRAATVLSAKPTNIGEAVSKQAETNAALRAEIQSLKIKLSSLQAEFLTATDGFLVVFADPSSIKGLVNKGLTLAKKGVVAFAGENGEYSYMIASETLDVRPLAKALNDKFFGKGGGRANACQGKIKGEENEIKVFIESYDTQH